MAQLTNEQWLAMTQEDRDKFLRGLVTYNGKTVTGRFPAQPDPKPTKAQLDNSDEDVRSYIARLEDAIEMARCELTLAAAYAEVMPHPTTNRAALIARIGNALTELGGPIERKTNGTD